MRREAWERTEEGLIFNGADAEQERRHGQGVQNGIAADVAGLHQLFPSGVVVRRADGHARLFVPVAHVHERVHLHRFHGIRDGESAGVRVQSVRHVHACRHARHKASVLRHFHAWPVQEHGGEKTVSHLLPV